MIAGRLPTCSPLAVAIQHSKLKIQHCIYIPAYTQWSDPNETEDPNETMGIEVRDNT